MPRLRRSRPGYVVAAGTGEVYSYVVHHHPPVPGKRLPMVIALVQLPEGVRMVGEMLGVSPDQVRIGLPVRAEFVRVDDDLDLPPGGLAAADGSPARTLVIDVTPTFVSPRRWPPGTSMPCTTTGTAPSPRGRTDIFVNILTTTGLVQRYVCDWAARRGRARDLDPAGRALPRG